MNDKLKQLAAAFNANPAVQKHAAKSVRTTQRPDDLSEFAGLVAKLKAKQDGQ